jgi:hypothetical protein
MLKKRKFAWFGVLFAVWCGLCSGAPPQPLERPTSDETITIHMTSGSSRPGSNQSSSLWTFHATGECSYYDRTKYVFADYHTPSPRETKAKWQSKADFERCKALLERTRFFDVKKQYDESIVGGHTTTVSISWGKRSHDVYFQTNDPPEGINSLTTFLEKCVKDAEASAEKKK